MPVATFVVERKRGISTHMPPKHTGDITLRARCDLRHQTISGTTSAIRWAGGGVVDKRGAADAGSSPRARSPAEAPGHPPAGSDGAGSTYSCSAGTE